MLFTFFLELVLLSCETFAELVVDCVCTVVVVGVTPGCCVITVDAAAETGRVVEIVDVVGDLASNFGEFVVDGEALEVCSAAEVKPENCVVDGAALEVCSVEFGDFVVDGAALEACSVAEVEFGDSAVNGAALEVCFVAEVEFRDFVVDCAALEVFSVVRVTVEDFVLDGAALEVCSVVVVDVAALEVCSVAEVKVDGAAVEVGSVTEVMFLYDCDDPNVAISHITVQAELSVCILFGTDVQILSVDPCMIGKPLES